MSEKKRDEKKRDEKKRDEKIRDDAATGSIKDATSEGPAHVSREEAMNRGVPGSPERGRGQSPPAHTDEEKETVVRQTGAQRTNPDPHEGSAATSRRRSGIPSKPDTPPTDEKVGEKDKGSREQGESDEAD